MLIPYTFQDEVVNFEDNSYTKEVTQVIWRNLKIIKGRESLSFLFLQKSKLQLKLLQLTAYIPRTVTSYEDWRNGRDYDEDDAYGYEGYGGYYGNSKPATPKQQELCI